MRVLKSTLGFSLLGLMLVGQAQAATVGGTINSSLILTTSCLINGVAGADGANFGALNFGTTTSLFTTKNAQVLGGGGGAMTILCSAGTTPAITLGAGSHDGESESGSRALFDGSTHYVGYDLYSDSGLSTLLAIDDTITLALSTGVAQTVNIYGKATGEAGLPAGTYTDTITVQLDF